jgi:hypothetical protein
MGLARKLAGCHLKLLGELELLFEIGTESG